MTPGMLLLLGVGMIVVSTAHRVPRSDDGNPLEAVVNHLSQDVAALKADLQAVKAKEAKKSALRAYLAASDITANAPIHWTVLTQLGGDHYDSSLGVYTAPYTGYYTIHYQLFHKEAVNPTVVDLLCNNNVVARAYCRDNTGSAICGTGLTTRLTAGDRVWVQSDLPGPYWQAIVDNIFSVVLVSLEE